MKKWYTKGIGIYNYSSGKIIVVYVLFMLFCSTFSTFAIQAPSQFSHATIQVNSENYRSSVLEVFPESFVVNDLSFDLDGIYQERDLSLLLGISSESMISSQSLLNGLFYLKQLGLYESIFLSAQKLSAGVFNLKFILRQHLVVDYLKMTGLLRNKQRLKNLYVMDHGDVFDQGKHRHSIECMQQSLREQGYQQAEIHDVVLQGDSVKSVVVRCGLSLGARFKIGKVNTMVDCIGNLDTVDEQQLSNYLDSFFSNKLEGKYFKEDKIKLVQDKVRSLLAGQGFIDTQIRIESTILPDHRLVDLAVFVTLEKKREFIIWGNSFFKKDQILEHLLLYGKSTWHFPCSIIADEIEQLYKGKGFWSVSALVKEERQRIFCFVQEGPRSAISSVVVSNASYLPATAMAGAAFKSALKTRVFDQELFKKSTDHFIKMYKNAGFWDASVCKQDFALAKKPNCYDLILTIDEGARRLMGNVSIPGHDDVWTFFKAVWPTRSRQGFDQSLLAGQKQWLIDFFKSKGYRGVIISYELVERDVSSDRVVDLIWQVQLPESTMKFGKTIILGNAKIPYHALMKECTYAQGQEWDKKELQATLKNLKEIKIFDSVQIYPGRHSDEFGCKPIFIKLNDADRYEMKTSLGLQWVGKNLQPKRGFTYKVGCGMSVNRLFSACDKWSVSADVTRFYRDINTTYEVPWLKGNRVRCMIKGYDELSRRPVFVGNQESLYKASRQGCLLNVSRSLGKALVSGSAGLEFIGLFEADQPSLDKIILYDKSLIGKKTGYLFVEPMVIWRNVDNELNPRKGFMSLISCKGMFDLQNKTSFCKVWAEHRQYVPLTSILTGAIKVRAGHVFNRSFEQIHPSERFNLGGPCSVRGYDTDYCPPFGLLTKPIHDSRAGLPACAHDIWRYAPQGGRTMLNLNLELRCDLYKNFGVVLFTDMGALFQDSIQDEAISFKKNVFAGSGFGVRYNTPIGPLRFDVGFKWNIQRPDFESRRGLYLSLGQAF